MAIIRKASLEDTKKTIELLKTFPPDPQLPDLDWEDAHKAFPSLVEGRGGCIIVAEEDGDIVGVITLGYSYVLRFGGIYALIEEIIISEKMRGKGIANLLLQAAIDEARSQGCPEIQVNGPSPMGHPVYLRNGFHDAGIHMKKSLL